MRVYRRFTVVYHFESKKKSFDVFSAICDEHSLFHFSLKIKLIIIQINSNSPRRISLSKKKYTLFLNIHSLNMNKNEEKWHIRIFLRCAFDAEPLLYITMKFDALIKQTGNLLTDNFKCIFLILVILSIVVCYLLCMKNKLLLFLFTIFVHSTPLNFHLLFMAYS